MRAAARAASTWVPHAAPTLVLSIGYAGQCGCKHGWECGEEPCSFGKRVCGVCEPGTDCVNRKCHGGCDESFKDSRMMDYRGCQTKTLCGAICQEWSSQSPNIHKTTAANYPDAGLGRHNYCRNPTRAERAWCYTVDGVHRWEYCLPLDVGAQLGEHIPE